MCDRKVNLFVVGAAKCGTTSLYRYFEEHPSFYTTNPKEPRYFATDIPSQHRLVKTKEEYARIYNNAPQDAQFLVDASPAYMYSANAAEEISKYNPDAHIVIMLRPPADLLHSVHAQYLWSCDEDIADFEKAWKRRFERENGKRIPHGCRNPMILAYHRFGLLGEQAERYFQCFPKKQIHVILFDDLKKDTRECFERLLQALEVPWFEGINFSPRNVNAHSRSKVLARIIHGKSPLVTGVRSFARKVGLRAPSCFWGTLARINERRAPRSPLSEELRKEIEHYFEHDVQKLERLLGRDLAYWRTTTL